MNNLWPEDIGPIPALKAPVTILREQASLLGKKTQQSLVEAEVVCFESISEGNNLFSYAFLIVAPCLNNYRHRLFTMYYDINLYPITINIDRDIHVEISNSIQGKFVVGKTLIAESEDDFVEILKKIFSAKKTKTIIGTLLGLISC